MAVYELEVDIEGQPITVRSSKSPEYLTDEEWATIRSSARWYYDRWLAPR